MSLKYHLIERPDMRSGSSRDKKLVYGQVRSCEVVDFETVCEMIEHSCTLTRADVKSVLSSLSDVLKKQLSLGHIVNLEELGRFRMTVRCRGVEEEKEFHTSCFKKPRIYFTPSVLLKRITSSISYERMTVVKPIGSASSSGGNSSAGSSSGSSSGSGTGSNSGASID